GGSVDDTSENGSWSLRDRIAALGVYVADHRRCRRFPRDEPERRQVGPEQDIGETRIRRPDRETGRRDRLLGDVPAEDHVALREARALAAGDELLRRHALAAVDAVYIGGADLHGLDAPLGDQLLNSASVHG